MKQEKPQTPKSKLQGNSKLQTSSSEVGSRRSEVGLPISAAWLLSRGLYGEGNIRMIKTLENTGKVSLAPVPICIGGEWQELNGLPATPVYNPSTGEVIAQTPACVAEHVHAAVEAAAA